MRPFFSVLLAVLNDEEDIPELPMDKLIANDTVGEPIRGEIPRDLLLRIARLQTLVVFEQEKSEIPEHETGKAIAEATSQSYIGVLANALGTSEDSARRVEMLRRLIIESVREAIPAENEKLDVEYFAHPSGAIFSRPLRVYRPLD